MNSLINGFVIAIVGIIIGVIAGFVVDCIEEEKWDIDELNRLRDKGYNYFIKDDEIIVYKRIKDGRLVRDIREIEEILKEAEKPNWLKRLEDDMR